MGIVGHTVCIAVVQQAMTLMMSLSDVWTMLTSEYKALLLWCKLNMCVLLKGPYHFLFINLKVHFSNTRVPFSTFIFKLSIHLENLYR